SVQSTFTSLTAWGITIHAAQVYLDANCTLVNFTFLGANGGTGIDAGGPAGDSTNMTVINPDIEAARVGLNFSSYGNNSVSGGHLANVINVQATNGHAGMVDTIASTVKMAKSPYVATEIDLQMVTQPPTQDPSRFTNLAQYLSAWGVVNFQG